MSVEQKENRKGWLSNLYSIVTMLTLFVIMAQVIIARRSMVESSEWEKAKVTIENIERFQENLKETALYTKFEVKKFVDSWLWPDFSNSENWIKADTLRKIYGSFFEHGFDDREDLPKTLLILNSFAYPIIMGYASEIGSYKSVYLDFSVYGDFFMARAHYSYPRQFFHAKLLYRLWRVRYEQTVIKDIIKSDGEKQEEFFKVLTQNIDNMWCFEGDEITISTLKQYEKKLERELKKIQKEIEEFRKSSLR